jgi:hypothetical protein
VHVPAAVRCTVVPLTLQSPAAANVIGRPDVVLALRAKSASPKVLSATVAKVITGSALLMTSVPVASAAL